MNHESGPVPGAVVEFKFLRLKNSEHRIMMLSQMPTTPYYSCNIFFSDQISHQRKHQNLC